MARGKQTCKILKEIRRQIAEANNIEFVTSECRHKGDCAGTCPKCEAEVRYLEQQLRARTLAGKAAVIAGISAGMMLMAGCGGTPSDSDSGTSQDDTTEVLMGEPPLPIEEFEEEDVVTEGDIEEVTDSDTIE